MKAGKSIGLIPAYHGEELNYIESTLMGVETGAISISHLEHVQYILIFSYLKQEYKQWH